MKVYNTAFTLSEKQTQPLLEYLLESASIGLWNIDLDSAKISWCPITKRIHGVDDNYEPTFETAVNFFKPGYSQDTITELIQACYTNFTKYDVELQIVTHKGQEKWVRTIGMPKLENGKCLGLHGLIQDIDEKIKTLKMLSFREEQFRKTFEYAVLGMALLNLEGQWIKVNNGLVDMLGYTQEELNKLTFFDLTHPEERHLYNIKRLITGRIENYQAEKRLIHKNGDLVYAIVSVSLIRDDMGEPLSFVAQINDISNFRKASNKIVQLLKISESQNKRLLEFAHMVSDNLLSQYKNIDNSLNSIEEVDSDILLNPEYLNIKNEVKDLGQTLTKINDIVMIKSVSG